MPETPLRLVIFDVDGTLIDSQSAILTAMHDACARAGHARLRDEDILGIVGLSLPEAMAVLFPDHGRDEQLQMVEFYKAGFLEMRLRGGGEGATPLYPGAREVLYQLDEAGYLLSIATGKARRGLDHMIETHGLHGLFIGAQTADDAPSKPNPQMVLNCMAATGATPENTVLVGDTEFDLAMARAAGCHAIGVAWGYHPHERMMRAEPHRIISGFEELSPVLSELWSAQ
ncbi:HAD-IA family hydrolase [Rhodobacteraceae bacterium NNCM2]|nr:HAD-IA family hydrolase [Coraliihabitans acroporae]